MENKRYRLIGPDREYTVCRQCGGMGWKKQGCGKCGGRGQIGGLQCSNCGRRGWVQEKCHKCGGGGMVRRW